MKKINPIIVVMVIAVVAAIATMFFGDSVFETKPNCIICEHEREH